MKIVIDEKISTYWKHLPVCLIRDSRLSYQARGVAAHLLSMSSKWELRASSLTVVLEETSSANGKMGKLRIQRILRELEKSGYLIRKKYRTVDGKWKWDATFFPLAGGLPNGVARDCFAVDGSSVDQSKTNEKPCDKSNVNKVVVNEEELPRRKNSNSSGELDLSHPILIAHLHVIESVCNRFKNVISVKGLQTAVDELAGVLIEIGHAKHVQIKSVRAWLQAVLTASIKGEFVAEFATKIERYRAEQMSNIEKKKLNQKQTSDPILKQNSLQISKRELSAIKSIVARKKGDLK